MNIHIHIGDIIFLILIFKAANDILLVLFFEIVSLKVFHNQFISIRNSFKRLNELFAMTGQVGFLASQRVDGKLILSEAVKTLTIKA